MPSRTARRHANRDAAASARGGSDQTGSQAQTRRRTLVPAVKKPFRWGVVTTSALVALLLVGIVSYAATHQGSGVVTALTKADRSVPGVHITKIAQRQHVTTAVTYNQSPPVGGPHNGVPQTCQVYNQPIANEHAVHSMEHGAVWITYRPGMEPAQIRTLEQLAQGNPYRLLSPYPGLTAPISLQAWGRQIFVPTATDQRIEQFLNAYTAGPQAPEPGSPCQGSTATGAVNAGR